jgi:hypothetical protein
MSFTVKRLVPPLLLLRLKKFQDASRGVGEEKSNKSDAHETLAA